MGTEGTGAPRADALREQAQKVAASGALGKTRSYIRLLDYLVEATLDGRAPKELEIATQVFGKGSDFDPSQDSLVRVYAHNLRQKLDHYYATAGRGEASRISIPRGEYRVVLGTHEDESTAVAEVAPRRRAVGWAFAALSGLAVGLLASLTMRPEAAPAGEPERVAAAPVWSAILDDDLPVLLVVGDYYIFAELDEQANVGRLIRDFSINSERDLDDLLMYQPELIGKYRNLDLTYLPRASAFAVKDLLRILYTADKPVRVTAMSELKVADLKTSHIVYVGYISALSRLEDLVFASSGLAIGPSFDELTNLETGQLYTSGAGLLRSDQGQYRDYALFSTFPGPGGNQFMVVAGMRDMGLMHSAFAAADEMEMAAMQAAVDATPGAAPSFEVLYEVTGIDDTNLDGMLVYSAPLNYRTIWGGELIQSSLRN
jgi:hypothetical protein